MVPPQKLCGSCQEGGRPSEAEDGAASEALWLSPGRWPVVWSRRWRRLRSSVALTRKVVSCLEPKVALPQKLCGSCREGGWLSGAEDGVAQKLCDSRPSQKRLALCIPHGHPCSLPSVESRSQEGSRRQKPLGLVDPCALTRKVAGCLEPKMAPPQKLCGSRPFQKLLASVFHTLTRRPLAAGSQNQGGSRRSLRQKPLRPGGPLCSHQEGGRLSGAGYGAASDSMSLF